jgi:hypothetical protein
MFTALPQDMLQHEISRFLNPLSRAEFNCVLKPDEHIYKKLPADYALTHHIRTVFAAYQENSKMVTLTMWLTEQGGIHRRRDARRFVRNLCHLLKFFNNPMNQLGIMYQNNLKDMLLRTWAQWQDDELMVYDYITEAEKKEIKENAVMAISIIKATPFVRHISTKNFQSVY